MVENCKETIIIFKYCSKGYFAHRVVNILRGYNGFRNERHYTRIYIFSFYRKLLCQILYVHLAFLYGHEQGFMGVLENKKNINVHQADLLLKFMNHFPRVQSFVSLTAFMVQALSFRKRKKTWYIQ